MQITINIQDELIARAILARSRRTGQGVAQILGPYIRDQAHDEIKRGEFTEESVLRAEEIAIEQETTRNATLEAQEAEP
jgi:hypothetical protein